MGIENEVDDREFTRQERQWKHRRRGYYMGIFWTVLSTIVFVYLETNQPGLIERIGVVVGWSYGVATTLILAYYGNTAVDDFSKSRYPKL